jgi:hypothetical protein
MDKFCWFRIGVTLPKPVRLVTREQSEKEPGIMGFFYYQ